MELPEERTLSENMNTLTQAFDNLTGKEQLEFIKIILEKMENGEIEISGKCIYPKDIGISDGYTCLSEIMTLLK